MIFGLLTVKVSIGIVRTLLNVTHLSLKFH